MRIIIAAALLLIVTTTGADAQNVIDTITQGFKTATGSWEAPLQTIAIETFGTLALIQFTWAMLRQALRQSDFSEIMAELLNQFMHIGLFFWLLTTFTTWGAAIINGFRQAAGIAGGQAVMSPGTVFSDGINQAAKLWSLTSIWAPADALGLSICAVVIVACFCWITAMIVLTLIQSYFLAATGVLFMGAGGSWFTKEISLALVRQIVAVAVKLFALQLVVSVGMSFVEQWSLIPITGFDVTSVLTMLGEALVLSVVVTSVPGMFERMVGGIGFAAAGELVGRARMAATITSAVASGLATAGLATGAGVVLASAQGAAAAAAGTAPTTLTGRSMMMVGRTASNIGSAGAQAIGARLSGRRQRFGQGLYQAAEQQWTQAGTIRQRTADQTPPPAGGTP